MATKIPGDTYTILFHDNVIGMATLQVQRHDSPHLVPHFQLAARNAQPLLDDLATKVATEHERKLDATVLAAQRIQHRGTVAV